MTDNATNAEMTKDEVHLLKWLSADDGQYGECKGKTLDSVIDKGLVEWKTHDKRGKDFGWVGLTKIGFGAVRKIRSKELKSDSERDCHG